MCQQCIYLSNTAQPEYEVIALTEMEVVAAPNVHAMEQA